MISLFPMSSTFCWYLTLPIKGLTVRAHYNGNRHTHNECYNLTPRWARFTIFTVLHALLCIEEGSLQALLPFCSYLRSVSRFNPL